MRGQSFDSPFAANAVRDSTKLDFQVQQRAGMANEPHIRYPMAMHHKPGQVLAQFVIDTTGRAVLGTFKALHSTDPLFTLSVYEALPDARFKPALIQGQKVAELVQEPFAFNINSR